MTDHDIALALRRLRERAGLTQADVALRMGVTPQHVSLLERGDRHPRVEMLRGYAEACGSSMEIVFKSDAQAAELVSVLQTLPPDGAATLLRIARVWARLPASIRVSMAMMIEGVAADTRRQ